MVTSNSYENSCMLCDSKSLKFGLCEEHYRQLTSKDQQILQKYYFQLIYISTQNAFNEFLGGVAVGLFLILLSLGVSFNDENDLVFLIVLIFFIGVFIIQIPLKCRLYRQYYNDYRKFLKKAFQSTRIYFGFYPDMFNPEDLN
jgi:hypothetical protein